MRQRIREKQTLTNKASEDVIATHFQFSWSCIRLSFFALMGSEESEMKLHLNIIFSDFTDDLESQKAM